MLRLAVLVLTVSGTAPLAVLDGAMHAVSPETAPPATTAPASSHGQDPDTSVATVDVPEKPQRPQDQGRRVVAELSNERTQDFGLLGVTWERGTADRDLVVQVRTRTDGEWTSWEDLEIEEPERGESTEARGGTSPTWVGESDGVGVRLLSAKAAPEDVQVALIDGGTGLAQPAGFEPTAQPAVARVATVQGPTVTTAAGTTTGGVAPKPVILTRTQWGVDRTYETPCSDPTTAPAAKGVVLHHTAGANGYTQEEAPGIVRAIHLYHTRERGWCDIGYNFLVDAYGTIYAGRRGGQDLQVRGAHAGNWEANLYTTGISMMGNFDEMPLPEPLKESVLDLTAWRLSYFGLDAIGTVAIDEGEVDIISGHRDIYEAGIRPSTATACPGKYGYEWLNGGMRDEVQARIDAAPAPTEPPPTEEPAPPVMSRVAGDSRYGTAAAIAQESFSATNGAVFLSSGETFPDALSGGPAAAGKSAPILLTRRRSLPAETIDELKRLAPSRIYILGGEGAVSAEVAAQASSYAGQVTRLAGSDRYTTGVQISRTLWPSADTVYMASGSDYPDALSGGALAARDGAPILLSGTDSLPKAVKDELVRLGPSRVVLLGGTGALSAAVRDEVAQAVPAASVSRLSGSDRYETSAAITRAGWTSAERAYFAAGFDFPDALAGVPAAAVHGAPLLLTTRSCLPAPVADAADGLGPIDRVLLGGTGVLDDSASTTRCG